MSGSPGWTTAAAAIAFGDRCLSMSFPMATHMVQESGDSQVLCVFNHFEMLFNNYSTFTSFASLY